MTERDLWGYRQAKRHYALELEKLKEFEGVMYSPASPSFESIHGVTGYVPDKIAEVADKHAELIAAVNAAAVEVIKARTALDRVDGLLSDDERAFLHLRYREGRSWEDLTKELHASRRTLCRQKKAIISKIEKVGTRCP